MIKSFSPLHDLSPPTEKKPMQGVVREEDFKNRVSDLICRGDVSLQEIGKVRAV